MNKVNTKSREGQSKSEFVDLIYTQTRSIARDESLLEERRLVSHRDSPEGNVFRVLRSQVLRKLDNHGMSSLAIVGAVPAIGKSMVAANLAVSVAQDVHRTSLLVDLDLRKPKAGWYFGFEAKVGVADCLAGRADLEDILVNPGFPRLVVAPGTAWSDPTELLSSGRTEDTIREINERYDARIVIYDLPPLLGVADALAVLPHVDAVLLVLEEGKTTEAEIEEMKRLLGDKPIAGAVINKASGDGVGYYYNSYYSGSSPAS